MAEAAQAREEAREASRAGSPWQLTWPEWKQVLWRTWGETGRDNIGLIASGVGFYGFLAIVPMLGALVLTYGLIADRATVITNVQQLTSVMPADAARLVGEQLLNVVQTSDDKKGFGLILALGIALFGARNGAGAIITALNIAYEEQESRGIVQTTLLALAITAAAVVTLLLAIGAITALGFLEDLLKGTPGPIVALGKILSYLVLLLVGAAGAAALYRWGPSRRQARWVWLSPGSIFTAVVWLLLTLGFGLYVSSFGNYNATYGSLGAVVVLLTWLYLSSYVLLVGAELNAELEHQVAQDTTVGHGRPLGERRAYVADHVAGGDTPAAHATNAPEGLGGQPPASRSVPAPMPVPARPALGKELLASRVAARATRMVDAGKAGLGATAAATIGLRLVRKGRPGAGAGLLAGAAGIAWLMRDRTVEAPADEAARH